MAENPTTNFGFHRPQVGGDDGSWGTILNEGFEDADGAIQSAIDDKLDKAGDTMTGQLTISSGGADITGDVDVAGDVDVDGSISQGGDAVVSSTGSGNMVVDLSAGNVFVRTLIDGDVTLLTPVNIPDGFKMFWIRLDASTAGHDVNFASAWRASGGGVTSRSISTLGLEFLCCAADGRVYVLFASNASDVNWS